MSKIIENYLLQEVIGQGQFGKVYKSLNLKTNEIFAIKAIKLTKFKEVKKLHDFTLNEIQILTKINNDHIIKFIEILKTSNNLYLVYEYCNQGTLEELLKKSKILTEPQALDIFEQILIAFKDLSKLNILHRDLKPSNILFHNGTVKIADFGFCKLLNDEKELAQTMVGSPLYMAPEVLKGEEYNKKADIWSLGVCLFEMLFGYCPFQENSIGQLIMKIQLNEFVIPKNINNISSDTELLLKSMIVIDQNYRIDWPDLLKVLDYFSQKINQQNQIKTQQNTQQISKKLRQQEIQNDHKQYQQIKQPTFQAENITNIVTQIKQDVVELQQQQFFQQQKQIQQQQQQQHQKYQSNINNQNEQSCINHQKNQQEQEFTFNYKILLYFRQKIVNLTNFMYQILERNFNQLAPLTSYMILKKILSQSQKFQSQIQENSTNKTTSTLSKNNFLKYLQQFNQYKNSAQFLQFNQLIEGEVSNIIGFFGEFSSQIQQLFATTKNSHIYTNIVIKSIVEKLQFEFKQQKTELIFKYDENQYDTVMNLYKNEIYKQLQNEQIINKNNGHTSNLEIQLQNHYKQLTEINLNNQENEEQQNLSFIEKISNEFLTINKNQQNYLQEESHNSQFQNNKENFVEIFVQNYHSSKQQQNQYLNNDHQNYNLKQQNNFMSNREFSHQITQIV